MPSTSADLRERRRRATAREIHQATLRLAARHGFEHVTVEMISAEAGVSRRTFFNYFPSKESAAVSGPQDLPEAAVAGFLAAPAREPVAVLRDLTGLLIQELTENPPRREELRQVMALAREHPAVMATLLGNFDQFERTVGAAVAQRLGLPAEDVLPALITSLAFSAVRTGLHSWSASEQSSHSPVAQVERTVALLHGFLVPDRTPTEPSP